MRTEEEIFMTGASSCKVRMSSCFCCSSWHSTPALSAVLQEYTQESLDFMRGIVQRSGVGPHSYMPDGGYCCC